MKTLKLVSMLVAMLLVSSVGICMAADEGVILPPNDSAIFDYQPALTKGTIEITEGWNLVAMPVLTLVPYSTAEFAKAVAFDLVLITPKPDGDGIIEPIVVPFRRPDWQVKTMAVYKNGRFETCYPNKNLTPYNMVPGEAYFVYAEYLGPRLVVSPHPVEGEGMPLINPDPWHPRTSVTLKGRAIKNPVSLNLNRGWNGISVSPFNPVVSDGIIDGVSMGPIFTLDQLSKELVEQGIKAKRAIFWNAEEQTWEQFNLPVPEDKTVYSPIGDPMLIAHIGKNINPSEGFFLLIEENGLYLPTVDLNAPEPPQPPERVSYTGKILPLIEGGWSLRLQCEDGTTINLKGKDETINNQLRKLSGNGATYTVEGIFTVVDSVILYPPFDPIKVKVLLVDTVMPKDPITSLKGVVKKLDNNVGTLLPNQKYYLVLENSSETVALLGINEEVNQYLEMSSNEAYSHKLEGKMASYALLADNGESYSIDYFEVTLVCEPIFYN